MFLCRRRDLLRGLSPELGPGNENKPKSKYDAVARNAENLVDRCRNLPICTLDAVGQASYDEFGENAC